jgi:hypothetical protein
MTEQQVKEYLSRHFLGLVASRCGFKTSSPQPDNGTDLHVTKAVRVMRPQGARVVDDPNVLHLQLKCTTESQTIPDGDGFKFDLEVNAYNDLVEKWNDNHYVRSMLVVMVLPDDHAHWLTISADEIVMRRAAYWFAPASGTPLSTNSSTHRVRISHANAVTLDFIPSKFAEYYAA